MLYNVRVSVQCISPKWHKSAKRIVFSLTEGRKFLRRFIFGVLQFCGY